MIGSRAYCMNRNELTFAEAEDACRERRGHLVTVNDLDEQDRLRARLAPASKLVGSAWIGLVEPFREGDWRWVNGERATFQLFGPGEPNDVGGEDCGEWRPSDGRWNDLNCFTQRPYICQSPVSPSAKGAPPPKGAPITCAVDGQRFKAGPLEICAHASLLNFADAQESCRKSGGHLAVIHNVEENEALLKALGSPIGPVDALWIGATDETREGHFLWTSGEPATFSNWNSGEPNNAGTENCATWIAATGKWNDAPCGLRMWSLCEGSASE